MIRWLYERKLLRGISVLPRHICFMITEEDVLAVPGKPVEVARWCCEISRAVMEHSGLHSPPEISGVTFHISTPEPAHLLPCLPSFRGIREFARLSLHFEDQEETGGEGMDVCVAVGKSGREEIAECIRRLAIEKIEPENIDEKAIEEHLTFRYNPDLVIKTGGSHLTDFLIWQSVYSELFFSDVNWRYFRRTDFLRALRDYQSRVRRFGK